MTLVKKRYTHVHKRGTSNNLLDVRDVHDFLYIPDVRIIFEKLYLMTNEGFCKFAIIDGIHMLSGEAN